MSDRQRNSRIVLEQLVDDILEIGEFESLPRWKFFAAIVAAMMICGESVPKEYCEAALP